MSWKNTTLSEEQKAIIEKIKALKASPNDMVTKSMGGKMTGFNSLSSSAYCGNCPKRIDDAMEAIRAYGKTASDLLDRYCLPSDDKRHITSKKLITELLKIDSNMRICVCIFCYAQRSQSWQDSARIKFEANHELLSEKLETLPAIPQTDDNGNCVFRNNAEGDCNSIVQALNEIEIAKENPNVTFVSWTKNIGYYAKAYEIVGAENMPKNFTLIISSPYINVPDEKVYQYYKAKMPNFVTKLFTVCTKDWANKNGIVFNCCTGTGEKHCKDCMLCYKRNNVDYIWEILR